MSNPDTFGLLSLPAAVADVGKAVTDPALDLVLSYCKAVVNADLGAAWAAVAPADPLPIAYVFAHDPDPESFNADETPALYLWRADDAGSDKSNWQDAVADDSGFHALWVPPPAEQEDRRARDGFRNGLKKCLKAALIQGRHPAWVLAGDTYYTPADYGSVLLYHAGLSLLRLGAFRAHKLSIESPTKDYKQAYDCVFFSVAAIEYQEKNPLRLGVPLVDAQGRILLASRANDGLLPEPTLDVLDYHFELALSSPVSPASGPVAGGTDVTIFGKQFVDGNGDGTGNGENGMVVLFGTVPSDVVQYVDEGTIIARSPPGTGTVDITVSQSPGGASKTLAGAFTYV